MTNKVVDAATAVLIKRVDTVASKITLFEPFLSAVFPLMERKFHTEPGITAYTDGRCIGFGVDFCTKLSDEELMFLCLHESMHVILMHVWRQDGRRLDLFNIAADAVINRDLKALGYTMPKDGVLVDWVAEAHSTEEVYARLLRENPPQERTGTSSGEGKPGEHGGTGGGGWDGEGDLAPAASAADEANIEATIMAAAKMAKACGDKSSLVERIVGGGLTPSVSWTDVLREVVTSATRDDYTYRRLNRRMLPKLVLPTLWSESIGGLVIGVDTSGSVSEGELNQIASEISAIVSDCRPEFVEVVYCDTSVSSSERFDKGDDITLHPTGGGGTRFSPVFEHAAGLSEPIAALIYLTDLWGDTEECEAPPYPVIWACTDQSKCTATVPFGTVVPVLL